MNHKDSVWVMHADAIPQQVSPGVVRRILAYTDGLMCAEHHFEKDAAGSMHSHPHTQLTYVASGVFEFVIGGEKRRVSAGDTLLKQNGVEHGCVCLEAGILVDIFAPMREDFLS